MYLLQLVKDKGIYLEDFAKTYKLQPIDKHVASYAPLRVYKLYLCEGTQMLVLSNLDDDEVSQMTQADYDKRVSEIKNSLKNCQVSSSWFFCAFESVRFPRCASYLCPSLVLEILPQKRQQVLKARPASVLPVSRRERCRAVRRLLHFGAPVPHVHVSKVSQRLCGCADRYRNP